MDTSRPSPKNVRRARASRDETEHRSVAALMKEAGAGESATDVMRRKCRAMVTHAKNHRWSGPPFSPEILASIHGVVVEPGDSSMDSEGQIFPRRGRVVIQYRPGAMIERQRFTVCHELAHTCFPDAFEFVRHHESNDEDAAHKRFENLCDVGAAELLMPVDEFMADLGSTHPTAAGVVRLGGRYVASIDATIRRIVDLTTHSCAAAFLTDQAVKDHPRIPGRWRVKFLWKSAAFRGFIPSGTLIPKDTVATSPEKSAQLNRETWWINNRPYSWYVESIQLPPVPHKPEYPKFVAFLHSRKP